MDMSDFVVRVRGLPWSAKEDDVIRFFGNCTIAGEKKGVHFTTGRDGRSTGEAYVELDSAEDLDKAIDHHKDHMGKRYIEVFKSTRKEMQWVIGKNLPQDDCVVRLRGLPYGCTNQEILDFFDGYEIAPNGIGIITDQMRRTTGEAYVQFMSGDIAQKAREERHMERIGHRYIEIFKSSMMEAENAMNRPSMGGGGPMRGSGPMGMPPMGGGGGGRGMGPRGMGMNNMGGGRPGPYDRPSGGGGGVGVGGSNFGGGMGGGPMRGNVKGSYGGNNAGPGGGMGFGGGRRSFDSGFGPAGPNISADNWQSSTGHSVHMRGLPYSATDGDILEFLAPLQPVSIHIHRNANDRPTGEADVDFAIHEEAKEAMKKDREKIGTRYIELFLKSSAGGKMGGGGGIGAANFQSGSNYQQGYQQGGAGGGWGDGDYQGNMGYGMSGGMGPGMNNMGGGGMNNMGAGMNNMGGGGGGMNNMGAGMNNMGGGGGGGMNNTGAGMNNMGGGGGGMNMGAGMNNMGAGMNNMGGGNGMNSMGGGGMNNMGGGGGMNSMGGGMNNMGGGGGMNNMDGMMGGGNMGMAGNRMGGGPGMGHMGGMMNNQYGNMGGDMGGGGGYGGYNDNTNFTAF